MGGHAPVNQQDAELVIKAVFVPSASSIQVHEGKNEILIFPNPVSDKLFVQIPDKLSGSMVSIYNSSGHKILEKEAIKENIEFDFSKLPSGIYYLKTVYEQLVGFDKIVKI
jgi:hypothetical protein